MNNDKTKAIISNEEPVENFCDKENLDQLCKDHGASTQIQVDQLVDMITLLPSDVVLEGEFVSVRSNTGRHSYQLLPDLPCSGKNYIPPKDGDLFIGGEIDTDLSRLEKLYQAGDLVSEFQIVGKDPELKPIKHPLIFKITDLAEDEEEFPRLKTTLGRNQDIEEMLGWPAPPMFIEAIPEANILDRAMDDVMKQLTALAREYKVDIYFGTKPALKTALYSLMYGAKKEDLHMTQLDEISVENAIGMYERKLRSTIMGGYGLGLEKMAKLLAEPYSEEKVCVDNPARDWEQSKLRRGKGHNKFKRKGKK